jgi:hypothetical protein
MWRNTRERIETGRGGGITVDVDSLDPDAPYSRGLNLAKSGREGFGEVGRLDRYDEEDELLLLDRIWR